MTRITGAPLLTAVAIGLAAAVLRAQSVVPFSHHVEVLTPARSLSAELAAQVPQPIGFVRADSGPYLILDRHAHTLFRMDPAWTAVRKLVEVGFGQGSLIEPGALAVNAGDVIAVADAPGGKHRIQFFTANGDVLGGFFVPATVSARLVSDRLVLNGVGSMQFKGTSFLINYPEAGGLIKELDMQGRIVRQIGELRATGYESDRALHLAFNTGVPLVDPAGGFFFVFQAGVPAFRKYDAAGTLLYERHIEGIEIDRAIQTLPQTWPARTGGDTIPVVAPLVRTAAVDSRGQLWVALSAPFTYVYDAAGDKIRTVQFRGAALISPASFSFARDDRLLLTPGCYEFATR